MSQHFPPKWADFDASFQSITGDEPFPYQRRLAHAAHWPELLQVPTGLGKTATILAWLWRRRYHPDEAVRARTPRRLVFCLPMRVLVEQVHRVISSWRDQAGLTSNDLLVVRLMGGETVGVDGDAVWDEHPEADMVIIGTQDQLLSRALNRGYAMSRARWPLPFAWLNNDALWVIDEIQLVGAGLETTAQLAGLRERLGTVGPTHTMWMSATPTLPRLDTADHPVSRLAAGGTLGLDQADLAHPEVAKRLGAKKQLGRATARLTKANTKTHAPAVAKEIAAAHVPGGLTLVVVNTVKRAQDIFEALRALLPEVRLVLVHGQMRPRDREAQVKQLDADGERIVVATQAIEAGVDLSATTLFTELAPWASLVQRFGRCNRRGDGEGRVFWIDVAEDAASPYEAGDLAHARQQLEGLSDVGPSSLADIRLPEERFVPHGFRRKDLLDLFDTTPDLLGNDLDVGRFIRDADDTDVQVFWRDLPGGKAQGAPEPRRDELCSVGIGAFKTFIKANAHTWVWDMVDDAWRRVEREGDVRPGPAYMLETGAGGYDETLGWTGDAKHKPTALPLDAAQGAPEGLTDEAKDAGRGRRWLALHEHTDHVVAAMVEVEGRLVLSFPDLSWRALRTVARYHDRGKAHTAFAAKLGRPAGDTSTTIWAKSGPDPEKVDKNLARPHFRHELASALAFLQTEKDDPERDLIAYLIAAHHGRVRVSLRAQPGEIEPPERHQQPFARGCWHNDPLPETDLGGGVVAAPVELNMGPMALGQDSWLSRVLPIRDERGPFQLAYMEALFRVADWRGSARGGPEQ